MIKNPQHKNINDPDIALNKKEDFYFLGVLKQLVEKKALGRDLVQKGMKKAGVTEP